MTIVTSYIIPAQDISSMITSTEKSTLKKRMLDVCIAKQESLIADFKERIKSLLESGPLGNEESYDNNELSQQAQKNDELEMLNKNLQFANDELKVLQQLDARPDRIFMSISPGAAVVTNTRTFFVGVSTEQFQVDGDSFIGLSTKSPLYGVMKDKKKGQKFSYEGTTYKIIDVY
jgi:hypothetical protein